MLLIFFNDFYCFRHYNKILDANAIFRFTGLSNNAQLEMVPCAKEREMLNITIGIQLEDGQRLMAEFSPNAVLSEILSRLVPDEPIDTAILVYMHREVCHVFYLIFKILNIFTGWPRVGCRIGNLIGSSLLFLNCNLTSTEDLQKALNQGRFL